ncbi:hypothetical protein [Georgenia sp. Z1491]|uniref:hypothetical protein n=1 Tax=Georgenia sp. Z1491 TaxID=3416707 RepID=UPI003CFAD84D
MIPDDDDETPGASPHRARSATPVETPGTTPVETPGTTPAATPARVPAPWRAATTNLGAVHLIFALGVVAAAALVLSVVVLIVHLAGTPGQSYLQYGFQLQVWFAIGMPVWAVFAGLDTLVPAGSTRRAVWIGTLVGACVSVVLAGALSTVVLWLESLVYDAAGWAHVARVEDGVAEPGVWSDGWLALGLERCAVLLGATFTGTLLGAAFYGLGYLGAALALPLSLVPVVAVGLVTGSDSLPLVSRLDLPGWADGTPAVPLGVLLAVGALAALGSWLLMRAVPVRMRPL